MSLCELYHCVASTRLGFRVFTLLRHPFSTLHASFPFLRALLRSPVLMTNIKRIIILSFSLIHRLCQGVSPLAQSTIERGLSLFSLSLLAFLVALSLSPSLLRTASHDPPAVVSSRCSMLFPLTRTCTHCKSVCNLCTRDDVVNG